jgi:hypothetical protein
MRGGRGKGEGWNVVPQITSSNGKLTQDPSFLAMKESHCLRLRQKQSTEPMTSLIFGSHVAVCIDCWVGQSSEPRTSKSCDTHRLLPHTLIGEFMERS